MMIRIENLDFKYSGKQKIFSGLNLSFEEGHIYGLLGKNGAGKTTLLKLITGLLFPKTGKIQVNGYEPRKRQPSLLSEIFFIPEEIFLPDLKLRKYAKLLAPFYPCFDMAQLEAGMEAFEITDQVRMDRLSYGQRKKAFICLGLACNTRLVLMDEPTNGLDIPSKSSFRRLISSAATENRCLLISTHQVKDLENLIDALVIVDESRILMNATTEEITERLVFRQLKENEPALFAEESLKGRWGVVPNTEGTISKLDMELLFNTVLKSPEQIKQIFGTIK